MIKVVIPRAYFPSIFNTLTFQTYTEHLLGRNVHQGQGWAITEDHLARDEECVSNHLYPQSFQKVF